MSRNSTVGGYGSSSGTTVPPYEYHNSSNRGVAYGTILYVVLCNCVVYELRTTTIHEVPKVQWSRYAMMLFECGSMDRREPWSHGTSSHEVTQHIISGEQQKRVGEPLANQF